MISALSGVVRVRDKVYLPRCAQVKGIDSLTNATTHHCLFRRSSTSIRALLTQSDVLWLLVKRCTFQKPMCKSPVIVRAKRVQGYNSSLLGTG